MNKRKHIPMKSNWKIVFHQLTKLLNSQYYVSCGLFDKLNTIAVKNMVKNKNIVNLQFE